MDDGMQYRLSLMGRDIEQLLNQNHVRAEDYDVTSRRNVARYVAKGCGPIAAATWDALEEDLKHKFGDGRVELTLEEDDLVICVDRPSGNALLQLLQDDVIPVSAVSPIGRDVDDRLINLDFGDRNARHVLFQGSSGAGKTASLRTCAISLALAARQSQVQMIFIAPAAGREEVGGPGLELLHYVPHALAAVAQELEDVANVLSFVVEELHHRRRYALLEPSIVVFIDDLDVLISEGGAPVRDPLRLLLAEGAQHGVYLVMAARPQCTDSEVDMGDVLTLKSVSRIVGRLDNECQAPQATGRAHHLRGRGDFLLLSDRGPRRFQAAYVDAYDLQWCLEWLQSGRPVRLLAQPHY